MSISFAVPEDLADRQARVRAFVADRRVQILGGQGVTGETAVARIFADMRAFPIDDGPSEVHRWSLAKCILKGPSR